MNAMTKIAAAELQFFGHQMNADSARSLDFLRQIEGTVVAVTWIKDSALGFARSAVQLAEGVASKSEPIPEEDTLSEFETAQDHLQTIHALLNSKLDYARRSPQLRETDGVVDAYVSAIDAVCEMNESIESLRWNIMQHNAKFDGDKMGRVLSSPAEIEAYFASL